MSARAAFIRFYCSYVLLCLCVSAARAVEPAPSSSSAPIEQTALDRYLAKPDSSYAWKLVNTIHGDGLTTYVVDMTSQTWRTTEDVDRTEWKHWLVIAKPDGVSSSKAMLVISGGSNRDGAPSGPGEMITQFAKGTQTVTAELRMVPNQPLIFGGDGKKRSEDDLIAYTWDKFMTTGDETWPARLPMVKSALRAMDTIQALVASDEGGGLTIDGFVVAGGSKRGWTTWLTGAVDPRVVAIVPIVIDVLNVQVSMRHHHDAYGFWAPAVWDYVRHKITDRAETPEYAALLKIEDPFEYRHRLTMPKFVVNAAGDEFFLPDSSQFYFDELPGEKYLRYVPNAKHSLAGTDARESIEAFYQAINSGRALPKFSWTKESDGSLHVTASDQPREVKLWQATNPKARDFRLDTLGKAYQSSPLEADSSGLYIARVQAPSQGWTAFFVEMTYDGPGRYPFKFTTHVSVVPDVLPHKGEPLSKK